MTGRGKSAIDKCQQKLVSVYAKGVKEGMIKGLLNQTRMSIRRIAKACSTSPNKVVAVKYNTKRTDHKIKVGKRSAFQRAITRRRELAKKLAKTITRLGHRRVPAYPSASSIALVLLDDYDIHVSARVVHSDLVASGMQCYVRPRRPFYASDERVIAARLRFCSSPRWQNPQIVKRIIFSDEHTVTTNDKGSHFMYCEAAGDALPRDTKNPFNTCRLMIWAAVGFNYKSALVFVVPTKNRETGRTELLTANKYKLRCLSPIIKYLVPTKANGEINFVKRKIFMQDGAACHTALVVKNYLRNKQVDFIDDWPATSPDLNPIETVWGLLDEQLSKFAPCERNDTEQFKKNVLAAWAAIPQKSINALVMGFTSSVERVLKNRGEHRTRN